MMGVGEILNIKMKTMIAKEVKSETKKLYKDVKELLKEIKAIAKAPQEQEVDDGRFNTQSSEEGFIMGLIGNTFRNILNKDIDETKRTEEDSPQENAKESAKKELAAEGPTPGGPTPGGPTPGGALYETIAKSPAGSIPPSVPRLNLDKTKEKPAKKQKEEKPATIKTPLIEKDDDEYSVDLNNRSSNKIDMNFKAEGGGVLNTSGQYHHYYHHQNEQSFVGTGTGGFSCLWCAPLILIGFLLFYCLVQ